MGMFVLREPDFPNFTVNSPIEIHVSMFQNYASYLRAMTVANQYVISRRDVTLWPISAPLVTWCSGQFTSLQFVWLTWTRLEGIEMLRKLTIKVRKNTIHRSSFLHCPHSMRSRVRVTVRCPSVCPSMGPQQQTRSSGTVLLFTG